VSAVPDEAVALPAAWERRRNEPEKAWVAFKLYRDLGAGDRSIRRVAQDTGKCETTLREWANEFHWAERAEEFDRYLDRQDQAYIEEVRKAAISQRMQAAGLMIDVAVAQLRRWVNDAAMGISPKISPSDAARLVETGTKIQRLEMGESTENIGVNARVTTLAEADLIDRAREILEREVRK
jgi:hypothetical protein